MYFILRNIEFILYNIECIKGNLVKGLFQEVYKQGV